LVASQQLPVGQWSHVTVELEGDAVHLHVEGAVTIDDSVTLACSRDVVDLVEVFAGSTFYPAASAYIGDLKVCVLDPLSEYSNEPTSTPTGYYYDDFSGYPTQAPNGNLGTCPSPLGFPAEATIGATYGQSGPLNIKSQVSQLFVSIDVLPEIAYASGTGPLILLKLLGPSPNNLQVEVWLVLLSANTYTIEVTIGTATNTVLTLVSSKHIGISEYSEVLLQVHGNSATLSVRDSSGATVDQLTLVNLTVTPSSPKNLAAYLGDTSDSSNTLIAKACNIVIGSSTAVLTL
jgi:hypothetical protein